MASIPSVVPNLGQEDSSVRTDPELSSQDGVVLVSPMPPAADQDVTDTRSGGVVEEELVVDGQHLEKARVVATDSNTVTEPDVQHNASVTVAASDSKADSDAACVGVITLHVANSKKEKYMNWLERIAAKCEEIQGFLGRDESFIPVDSTSFGVSILLKFDTNEALLEWTGSHERKALIAEANANNLFLDAQADYNYKKGNLFALPQFTIKTPKILPPPKWKLWLLTWFQVYVTLVAETEMNMLPEFMEGGWLDQEIALLVQLVIIVSFIMYGFSPFLLSLHIRGYGLGAWLKRGRIKFQKPDPERHGTVIFTLRVMFMFFVELANDGFTVFNPPPPAPPPAELTSRVKKLEGLLDGTKRKLAELRQQIPAQRKVSVPDIGFSNQKEKQATALISEQSLEGDGEEPVAVTVHHRIRWESTDEFKQWQKEMIDTMAKWPGYISTRLISPKDDAENGDFVCVYSVIFKFDTVKNLQNWMLSKDRIEKLAELEPLLAENDEIAATKGRHLPDVFSDVFTKQGQSVSHVPPSKWKVVVLTTFALYLTLLPMLEPMPVHLARWGVESRYVSILVLTMFVTFIVSYGTAPVFTNFFGHWLRVPRPSYVHTHQPFKLFEKGFTGKYEAIWTGAIVFAFFLTSGLLSRQNA